MIGCCDLSEDHGEVGRTTDDYLWLKLSSIKSRTSNDSETFSYSDLQKMILEEYGMFLLLTDFWQVTVMCMDNMEFFYLAGETHFKAYEKPVVYFQVLALTGQFEAAIEFLSKIPR